MSNIAYLRVSHTESLNGTSMSVQETKCRAFAELHGFSIDKVYQECVSGSVEFRKRPVFQKVLSELKSNSKLVVSRLDRLSRKVVDTLKLIDDFKKQHKEICITDIGNIHTDGVSKIFVTILASLAEIERENISIRIKASKKIARQERRHQGGYLEFAYSNKYNFLITMDADFTHNPKYIKQMLKLNETYPLIIGSRHIEKNSIQSWPLFRQFLTYSAFYVTKNFLNIRFDATSGFRSYNLIEISQDLFKNIKSQSYSFFVETSYILNRELTVKAIPIEMPIRFAEKSKMKITDMLATIFLIIRLFFRKFWIM